MKKVSIVFWNAQRRIRESECDITIDELTNIVMWNNKFLCIKCLQQKIS